MYILEKQLIDEGFDVSHVRSTIARVFAKNPNATPTHRARLARQSLQAAARMRSQAARRSALGLRQLSIWVEAKNIDRIKKYANAISSTHTHTHNTTEL